ncbi:MAG: hypothetical protein ACC662_02740 [Planctomycetota bacterium]
MRRREAQRQRRAARNDACGRYMSEDADTSGAALRAKVGKEARGGRRPCGPPPPPTACGPGSCGGGGKSCPGQGGKKPACGGGKSCPNPGKKPACGGGKSCPDPGEKPAREGGDKEHRDGNGPKDGD